MVAGLGLVKMRMQDLSDLGENPHNPKILETSNPVIDRYIQRAKEHPELQARGEALRQRLEEVGFDGTSSLLVTGRKAK